MRHAGIPMWHPVGGTPFLRRWRTERSTTSPASARGGVTPSSTPATTSSSSSSTSPGAATSAPASEHPQAKFTGMPKHCPSPDEITLALRVSIPKVYGQTMTRPT